MAGIQPRSQAPRRQTAEAATGHAEISTAERLNTLRILVNLVSIDRFPLEASKNNCRCDAVLRPDAAGGWAVHVGDLSKAGRPPWRKIGPCIPFDICNGLSGSGLGRSVPARYIWLIVPRASEQRHRGPRRHHRHRPDQSDRRRYRRQSRTDPGNACPGGRAGGRSGAVLRADDLRLSAGGPRPQAGAAAALPDRDRGARRRYRRWRPRHAGGHALGRKGRALQCRGAPERRRHRDPALQA